MKFIVDAQLPIRLARWLTKQGYDAIHTLTLPEQNLTQDMIIIKLSMEEQRIVISKDSDFYDYYVIKNQPHKLLIVSTGNIKNSILMSLFEKNFETLIQLLKKHTVVELNNTDLIVHV